jgi:hypothetical protein
MTFLMQNNAICDITEYANLNHPKVSRVHALHIGHAHAPQTLGRRKKKGELRG